MITHDILNIVNNVIDYSLYCSAKPMHWIGCAKFWASFYFSLSFLMFVIFVCTAYKIYKDKRDYQAYLKKKADREKIASPEVMAQHIWRSEIDS